MTSGDRDVTWQEIVLGEGDWVVASNGRSCDAHDNGLGGTDDGEDLHGGRSVVEGQ